MVDSAFKPVEATNQNPEKAKNPADPDIKRQQPGGYQSAGFAGIFKIWFYTGWKSDILWWFQPGCSRWFSCRLEYKWHSWSGEPTFSREMDEICHAWMCGQITCCHFRITIPSVWHYSAELWTGGRQNVGLGNKGWCRQKCKSVGSWFLVSPGNGGFKFEVEYFGRPGYSTWFYGDNVLLLN